MRFVRRAVLVALVVIAWGATGAGAQGTAATDRAALHPDQMEAFLLGAEIVRMQPAGDGVTNSRRATLFDGRLTHDAHVQVVDEAKMLFDVPGRSEVNFKDSYRYNIAGYRLARLLELDNIPMSVERRVEGKPAAITWWVDDVMMDEGDRQRKKVSDPDVARGAGYVHRQRVFDELIQNRDRNLGNLLYTTDWKMWMIDHSRAFRLGRTLRKPGELTRVERSFFENLKKLTRAAVSDAVGKSLTADEIGAVLARRDVIVKRFEDRMAKEGVGAVLYTLRP